MKTGREEKVRLERAMGNGQRTKGGGRSRGRDARLWASAGTVHGENGGIVYDSMGVCGGQVRKCFPWCIVGHTVCVSPNKSGKLTIAGVCSQSSATAFKLEILSKELREQLRQSL